MKVPFITNYRLDLPNNPITKKIELTIPEDLRPLTKEELILQLCGRTYSMFSQCTFYKDAQVMAPFLERPFRLKYVIKFPNCSAAVLDAVVQTTELTKKAKDLKDRFDLAVQNNKSEMKIKYQVLVIINRPPTAELIEKEYDVLILSIANAIKLFKHIAING